MPLESDFNHDHIRILIVEGENVQADALLKWLTEASFRKPNLLVAKSFDDAISMIEKEKIHVTLVDYDLMPRTGFELMEEITRMGNPVPVIMTAQMKDSKIDSGAMSRGAYDYLVHADIDSEVLERTIRYTVIRRKLEDRLVHAALYDELSR